MNERSKKLLIALKNEFKTSNPFHIIEMKGIYLEFVPFNKKTIGLYKYGIDEQMILLNEKIEHSPEKYFYAAHELHHALEHSDQTAYYVLNSNSKGKMEQQANAFGAVMCKELFLEENGDKSLTSCDLKRYYGVPIELSEILL